MRDRRTNSFSCGEAQLTREWSSDNPEKRANRYAADLLLPETLFRPRAQRRDVTFATVRELASIFETSLTATAIRLVEHGSFPAMVVCTERRLRPWFFKSAEVPKRLWPLDRIGTETLAASLEGSRETQSGPVDVAADQWIDHPEASRYELVEDSIRIPPNLVLSLLWWKDETQVVDAMDEADDKEEEE